MKFREYAIAKDGNKILVMKNNASVKMFKVIEDEEVYTYHFDLNKSAIRMHPGFNLIGWLDSMKTLFPAMVYNFVEYAWYEVQ